MRKKDKKALYRLKEKKIIFFHKAEDIVEIIDIKNDIGFKNKVKFIGSKDIKMKRKTINIIVNNKNESVKLSMKGLKKIFMEDEISQLVKQPNEYIINYINKFIEVPTIQSLSEDTLHLIMEIHALTLIVVMIRKMNLDYHPDSPAYSVNTYDQIQRTKELLMTCDSVQEFIKNASILQKNQEGVSKFIKNDTGYHETASRILDNEYPEIKKAPYRETCV